MADKYLNNTGLQYFYNRLKTIFASQTDLSDLSDRVDDIVAEGGEPNVIESISVNGSTVAPVNKNVALTIPTSTSDLINDGDGTSDFATESYVDQNGGKIDVIQVNSTALPISNKTVNIDLSGYALSSAIPTTTSQLTNNSDFQTSTQVQALIDSELADITGFDFEVVQTLPAQGIKGIIYLVSNSRGQQDLYDEYIWVEPTGQTAHFEKIGTTDIDLSDYWTSVSGQTNSLIAITTAEIDAIMA